MYIFINFLRVKFLWISIMSKLVSPLWIEDRATSLGFYQSKTQLPWVCIILFLKGLSHLNWKSKYLFRKKSSSASMLLLYCFFFNVFSCLFFCKIVFNIFLFLWYSWCKIYLVLCIYYKIFLARGFFSWFLFRNSIVFFSFHLLI